MHNLAITQLKGFLVFLVVFGHLIEGFSSSFGRDWLYNLIYSFHMPAFVAISGVLFKIETPAKKLAQTILIPFVVYNIIFELSSYGSFGKFTHNFYQGAPYWHLWFLLALFIWKAISPAFLSLRWPLLASLGIAFLFPNFKADGYLFSLGRILHFFPFFLLGYLHKDFFLRLLKTKPSVRASFLTGLCFTILCFAYWIPTKILYGSYTYSQIPLQNLEGLAYTAASFTLGSVGVFFTFYLAPRLPFFQRFGESSLTIYILHAFFIMNLGHELNLKLHGDWLRIPVAVLLAIIACWVLSTTIIQKINNALLNKMTNLLISKSNN